MLKDRGRDQMRGSMRMCHRGMHTGRARADRSCCFGRRVSLLPQARQFALALLAVLHRSSIQGLHGPGIVGIILGEGRDLLLG